MSNSQLPSSDLGEHAMALPAVMRCEYRLFDADGTLVEAATGDEALELLVGDGPDASVLERALSGAGVGEKRRVQLAPGEAFGARDESALVRVERSELPAAVAIGDELEAESDDGQTVFLRVLELDDDSATLDANHPLSGQAITLELSVLEARPASEAEIAGLEAPRSAAGVERVPDVLSSRLVRKSSAGVASAPPETPTARSRGRRGGSARGRR